MFEDLANQLVQLQPLDPQILWILCLAFVIAFLLAFSVGANDVSNSFGTSVGSRVLTVTQACILATFFEAAGATLLGYSVCDTFRRKMYDVQQYDGAQRELMLGALACLIGSAVWNLVATALKMPISGTHSIVGATIGFSVVLRGWDSIRWMDMLRIVASWFASPLISGAISSLIYIIISKTIIRKIDPLRHGLKALPLFYGVTIFINVASIVIDGPEVFGLNELPWYAGLFISTLAAAITICCVAMILVPKLRRETMNELIARKVRPAPRPPTAAAAGKMVGYDNATFKHDHQQEGGGAGAGKLELALDPAKLAGQQQQQQQEAGDTRRRPPIAPKPAHLRRQVAQDRSQHLEEIDLSAPAGGGGGGGPKQPQQQVQLEIMEPQKPPAPPAADGGTGERYEVARLFSSLQILTACFASFAHGTNDVSNAVAPLIPIWNIYADGKEDIATHTPIWILAFGSIGICTGLWAWGRAVMGTVADGITKITPSKGFSIELGAAISVLLATKLGLPISTTHCKVGSLVVVGLVSSKFLAKDHMLDNMLEAGKDQAGKDQPATDGVDWKMFGGIALTWIVTVPFAGLASAIVMLILKWTIM